MVKVKINYKGQVVDFDLNRDLPLQTIIDAICTQLNVPPPKTDYSLQVDGAPNHISAAVRFLVSLCGPNAVSRFTLFEYAQTVFDPI